MHRDRVRRLRLPQRATRQKDQRVARLREAVLQHIPIDLRVEFADHPRLWRFHAHGRHRGEHRHVSACSRR